MILGATWEYALFTGILSLAQTSPAGVIWTFVATCCGLFFVTLSMAEMASMAPTAGGQYHWVSEFASPNYQRLLSYIVGWLCVLGWQVAMCGVALVAADQYAALISLALPDYTIQNWHLALLTIGLTGFAVIANAFSIRNLPMLQGITMVLHVAGFIAVFVILWVMGERSPARETFLEIEDNAGWGNTGLACLVGLNAPILTFVGADLATHLSEELYNASWVLPRAMMATAVTNYILGGFPIVESDRY